jgi:hypothetical protein
MMWLVWRVIVKATIERVLAARHARELADLSRAHAYERGRFLQDEIDKGRDPQKAQKNTVCASARSAALRLALLC